MSSSKQNIIAHCYDRKGKLISVGHNHYDKTHPLQAHFAKMANLDKKIFLHAEIDALLKSKGKEVYRIHITRINKKGELVLAAPCPICQLALEAFGVKKITFSQ